MASFVLSFFTLDVLDGIWDLIESVSEGFLTYSSISYDAENCSKGLSSNGPNLSEFILTILKSHIHFFFMLPTSLQKLKKVPSKTVK